MTTSKARLTLDDLCRTLAPRLKSELRDSTGFSAITPLVKKVGERSDLAVADGVSKLLVRGTDHTPAAVVLVSSPKAPGLVARGMQRAREAKLLLGPKLGAAILTPLAEGEVEGLTFAALPHCRPLTTARILWTLQRRRIRPLILDWLREATAATMQTPSAAKIYKGFISPLQRFAGDADIPRPLRDAADGALSRIESGRWSPRHILMHNDLWQGNILIDDRNVTGRASEPWAKRFVIIDWPGAAIEGYGLHDLLRFARAVALNTAALRQEILAHCRILECEPIDASSNLVAAFAYLADHLEHFPKPAFIRTAMACWESLASVGALAESDRASATPKKASVPA